MYKGCLRDTVLEVDLDSINFNVNAIKQMVGDDIAIAAVVKSDAYGHGAVDVAQLLLRNGVENLAVATLTEALELRVVYREAPIFIMGYTPSEYLEYVVKYNITQTIFSIEQAQQLDILGQHYNKRPRVHIKYDTGFNRLGYSDSDKSIEEIIKIFNCKHLEVEGIFSHFALAGAENDKLQFEKFISAIDKIESQGLRFKYKHICDSIACVDYPKYRLNMVRVGAALYGLKSHKSKNLELKQAAVFKSRVYRVNTVKKGAGVSYRFSWRAAHDSVIATIPLGYADGYPRAMTGKGYVTIRGKKAPVVGTICMDQCMVDITNIKDVRVGDEVVVYSDGADNSMSIQKASDLLETNKNDIICRIGRRTPRVYIENGCALKVRNYL